MQLAPTAPLQLGFAGLQLQTLKLHGQSHVPSDLQLALEERLGTREGGKCHGHSCECEVVFSLC